MCLSLQMAGICVDVEGLLLNTESPPFFLINIIKEFWEQVIQMLIAFTKLFTYFMRKSVLHKICSLWYLMSSCLYSWIGEKWVDNVQKQFLSCAYKVEYEIFLDYYLLLWVLGCLFLSW